jgi:hypothetical protein
MKIQPTRDFPSRYALPPAIFFGALASLAAGLTSSFGPSSSIYGMAGAFAVGLEQFPTCLKVKTNQMETYENKISV